MCKTLTKRAKNFWHEAPLPTTPNARLSVRHLRPPHIATSADFYDFRLKRNSLTSLLFQWPVAKKISSSVEFSRIACSDIPQLISKPALVAVHQNAGHFKKTSPHKYHVSPKFKPGVIAVFENSPSSIVTPSTIYLVRSKAMRPWCAIRISKSSLPANSWP